MFPLNITSLPLWRTPLQKGGKWRQTAGASIAFSMHSEVNPPHTSSPIILYSQITLPDYIPIYIKLGNLALCKKYLTNKPDYSAARCMKQDNRAVSTFPTDYHCYMAGNSAHVAAFARVLQNSSKILFCI